MICITLGKSLTFLGLTFLLCKGDILHSWRFLLLSQPFSVLCHCLLSYYCGIQSTRTVDLPNHKKIFSNWCRYDEMVTLVGGNVILDDSLAISIRSLENIVPLTQ